MQIDRRDTTSALTGGAVYPSLRGRSVFITGGGSGIGACLTEAFTRQGSLVAFVDIAEAPSLQLVEKLEREGLSRPWYRKADVTDIPALQEAIRDAARALGDFHVLVNNVASDDRHDFTRRDGRGARARALVLDAARSARPRHEARAQDRARRERHTPPLAGAKLPALARCVHGVHLRPLAHQVAERGQRVETPA